MPTEVDASPPPSSHLSTLARMGYSFTTAVGDIVDNSVAAGASLIHILLLKHENQFRLSILDNGCGMDKACLLDSMVIGCKDPRDHRAGSDLGRFGAGLKTASFSQAKNLTVLSWQQGASSVSGAKWDTELVKARNSWCLLELTSEEATEELQNIVSPMGRSGSVVIWDQINVLDAEDDPISAEHIAGSMTQELHTYLGLHFHRFLESTLEIQINGARIKTIDPFLRSEPGYAEGPREVVRSKQGKVTIKAHTLPRPSSLQKETLELHGGATAISEGQGLYLYRNKRLISGGGWHGVARSTELNNLARIQIDITADMDNDWETDVKKSRLSVPPKIKQVLRRITPAPISSSRKTHKYAGKVEEASALWLIQTNLRENEERTTYIPDTSNARFRNIMSSLNAHDRRQLADYILDLSKELPVRHIYATYAASPTQVQHASDLEKELEELERLLLNDG